MEAYCCYRNGMWIGEEDNVEDAKELCRGDIHDREVCGQYAGIYEIKSSASFKVRLYMDATRMSSQERRA